MTDVTGSNGIGGTNQSAENNFGGQKFWYEWVELSSTPGNLSQAGFDIGDGTLGGGQTVYNAGGSDSVNVPGRAGALGNDDDNFAVRVTTTLTVGAGGTYTFSLGADDGARLYVDGVQVVDNDGQHSFQTRSGTTDLAAGQHEVTILYFEAGGDQRLASSISGPDTNGQSVALQNANVRANDGADSIDAGDGNDVVDSGTGEDTVDAGAGDDTVYGGPDADSIFGGDGNDRIEGRDGADTIDGGAGDDTIVGYDSSSINSGGIGVAADDGSADSLAGGAGNDLLAGGRGDDTLDGGTGNDTLDGGDGNDSLFGGAGRDFLVGGTGADTLLGSSGADTLLGQDGEDLLDGGADNDVLDGGANNDTLIGGSGRDSLSGGEGDDSLDGGADADTLRGGNGNDTLSGGEGRDALFGEAGDDVVIGGTANDTLDGGAGADLLEGGSGDDVLDGGEGDDTLRGGDGDDFLTDADGTNRVEGGAGNDTIRLTGNGDQSVDAGSESDDVTIFVSGGARTTVDAGTGDDTVRTGDSRDTILGGDGRDSITSGAGDDSVEGGDGEDTIRGISGDDTILGGAGSDTIDGGEGDDLLGGDEDDDTIGGGEGNDTIDGGTGDDVLTGGEGFDRFTVSQDDDTITDFNTGSGQDFRDGDQGNNDFLDLSPFYDDLFQARDDLADDGLLNQSNADRYDYSDNTGLPGTIDLLGTSAADLTFDNVNLLCFAGGTRLAVPGGEAAIEDLAAGDLVTTLDHGAQRIAWIGSRTVPARGRHAPVVIARGALGNTRELRVSPQHRMLLSGWRLELSFGLEEALAPAIGLVNDDTIRQVEGGEVTYFHVLFDSHQIVFAEGAASESFHPGEAGMGTMAEAAREEILDLFPELRVGLDRYGPSAREGLRGFETRMLAAALAG